MSDQPDHIDALRKSVRARAIYCIHCGGVRPEGLDSVPATYTCTICGGTSWSTQPPNIAVVKDRETGLTRPVEVESHGVIPVRGSEEIIATTMPPPVSRQFLAAREDADEARKLLRELVVAWLVGLDIIAHVHRAAEFLVPDGNLVKSSMAAKFSELLESQLTAEARAARGDVDA